MKTEDVEVAVRATYNAEAGYALLFDVPNGTGSRCAGWADAVAVSLWPSRGHEFHGFEFKVSRGDWKRELADPAKSDNVQKYCDRWSIVAPKGVLEPNELPKTWGWIEAKEDGTLKTRVAAPPLEPVRPLPISFIVALLRREAQASDATVEAIVQKRLEPLVADAERRAKNRFESRLVEHKNLAARCDEIKALCGVDLRDWTPSKEIAAAIKAVLDGDFLSDHSGLSTTAKATRALADRLDTLLLALAQHKPETAKETA